MTHKMLQAEITGMTGQQIGFVCMAGKYVTKAG
jgi:hypothetical protein